MRSGLKGEHASHAACDADGNVAATTDVMGRVAVSYYDPIGPRSVPVHRLATGSCLVKTTVRDTFQ